MCSLLFVNPQAPASETDKIYEKLYFDKRDVATDSVDPAKVKEFRMLSGQQRLRDIAKTKTPPGRLLDVGCAEGFFLEAAKAGGWECYGVELSSFAAEVASKAGVGEVFCGTLRDAKYPDDHFDVVTMFDVIEHLHDPRAELEEVRRILKPGGLYYLLTPDAKSPAARLMGKRWFEIKPPEHLFYFSTANMNDMLRAAGFEKVTSHAGGKVLTFEYIALVLSRTTPWLSKLLRLGLGWLPIYRRPISFRSGFLLAQGLKPGASA
jgi:2-polyprenyl-3-methyl-5-hydroxy-6-metoxy-1,4-benzoquinol methylase